MKTEMLKEHKLPSAVLALTAAPGEVKTLYAACVDGHVYSVDAESGAHESLAQHENYASGVRLLPKANQLISAGYDGALIWTDLATKKQIRRVKAHNFWSWKMVVSPDEKLVASATGQYLPGGYKYEPAAGGEPTVKVYDAASGEQRHAFNLTAPALSVALSPDGKYCAAANMMGDLRVWDLASGKELAAWNTPDYTSWGIIKSHHYCGGIYGLAFTPDSSELIAVGMGPMGDPMAGNGKQTWQRFAWRETPPKKTGQIPEDIVGRGLMEAIAFLPSGNHFFMAGRMVQGAWNVAFFDRAEGKTAHSFDAKMRVTDAVFDADGKRFFVSGATGQEKKKDGKFPPWGRIKSYKLTDTEEKK